MVWVGFACSPTIVYRHTRPQVTATAILDSRFPAILAKDELAVVVTHELGHVTLGHRSIQYPSSLQLFTLRRDELEANERGVAIMVRFLVSRSARRPIATLTTWSPPQIARLGARPSISQSPTFIRASSFATYGAASPTQRPRPRATKTEPFPEWRRPRLSEAHARGAHGPGP